MTSFRGTAAAAPSGDLAGLTFALAGAGRVGSSLGRWAAAAGARATAVAVHRSGAGLARELGAEPVPFERFASGGSDLLLVAVADPALDAVAAALARRPQAAVVLHTAGGRGAEALAPLGAAGSAVGTLHPLLAFPRPLPDPAAARGAVFAVGGDPPAERLAERLARAWGGVPVTVPDEHRVLYHLAASLAAGGAVTLVAAAAALARRLGLPPAVGAGYLALARGALAEVDAAAPAAAITGPAARGDAETIGRQLAALAAADPDLVPLVADLTEETLRRLGEELPGALGDGHRRIAETVAAARAETARAGRKRRPPQAKAVP